MATAFENRLNPTAFTTYVPQQGLFTDKFSPGAVLYIRTPQGLKQFDVVNSLLTDEEKRRIGNYGAQIETAKERLKSQYGLDISSVPTANLADVQTSLQSQGLGKNNAEGQYIFPSVTSRDINEFITAPKATIGSETYNTGTNVLGSQDNIRAGINVPSPASASVTPPTTNLQPGQSGDNVKQLQNWLISQGYTIPAGATGYYGDQTKGALAKWQADNGVAVDGNAGYFGPKTMAAISKLQTSPTSQSSTTAGSQGGIVEAAKKVVNEAIESGQINPNITAQDIANIKWQDFIKEAQNLVSPQFKERINSAISGLLTAANRTEEDLTYGLNKGKTDYEKGLETGQESFSDRGLAFSGARNKYERDLGTAFSTEQNRLKTEAFRGVQDALQKTEQQVGTTALSGTGLPTVGGRSLSLSSSPVIGSDVYTQQSQEQDLARKLAEEKRSLAYYALNKIPS